MNPLLMELYKAGWRPSSGWAMALGLVYAFVGQPVLAAVMLANGLVPVPPVSSDTLMYLVGGASVFGGVRAVEKIKAGTAQTKTEGSLS